MIRTAFYLILMLAPGALLVTGCRGDQPAVHDRNGLAVKPAGKVGPDLAKLYQEWAASKQASGEDGSASAFEPSNPNLRVADGTVVVDAVSAGPVEPLIKDFEKLGAHDIKSFRTTVSARVPLAAIPSLEGLASLESVKPAYARTH